MAPTPEPPDPRVGTVLQGRYRLDALLASGAMGVVYRGQRVQLERPVAVKFLHPWIATQKAFIARFDTEARAMSRLQHPNCVSVIDFGVEGTPYLVMDFVTGNRAEVEVFLDGSFELAAEAGDRYRRVNDYHHFVLEQKGDEWKFLSGM